jgi:hypothetical protein
MDRFAIPIGIILTLMVFGALITPVVYVMIEAWKECRAGRR